MIHMHSRRSGRAGGDTSMYRATRDIEMVARFGRRRAATISAYLWESDHAAVGLITLMTVGGHTLYFPNKGMRPRAISTLLGPDTPGEGLKAECDRKKGDWQNPPHISYRRDTRRRLGAPKVTKGII